MAIVFTSDYSWRSTSDGEDPDPISGCVELEKDSRTFKSVVIENENRCKVTINYIDWNTHKILKSIYRIGKKGDAYKTYKSEIEGYKLVETSKNTTGIFTTEEIVVEYMYGTNGRDDNNSDRETYSDFNGETYGIFNRKTSNSCQT